jgi:hypothetical protein
VPYFCQLVRQFGEYYYKASAKYPPHPKFVEFTIGIADWMENRRFFQSMGTKNQIGHKESNKKECIISSEMAILMFKAFINKNELIELLLSIILILILAQIKGQFRRLVPPFPGCFQLCIFVHHFLLPFSLPFPTHQFPKAKCIHSSSAVLFPINLPNFVFHFPDSAFDVLCFPPPPPDFVLGFDGQL